MSQLQHPCFLDWLVHLIDLSVAQDDYVSSPLPCSPYLVPSTPSPPQSPPNSSPSPLLLPRAPPTSSPHPLSSPCSPQPSGCATTWSPWTMAQESSAGRQPSVSVAQAGWGGAVGGSVGSVGPRQCGELSSWTHQWATHCKAACSTQHADPDLIRSDLI